ncbi:hypothetical protein Tco_1242193 [Tanacetum coccineum]
MLAGLVMTKIMHTADSLSLINVVEASLRKYLENQLEIIQGNELVFKEMKFCEPLVNTVVGLNSRLESLIKAALDMVSANNVKSFLSVLVTLFRKFFGFCFGATKAVM